MNRRYEYGCRSSRFWRLAVVPVVALGILSGSEKDSLGASSLAVNEEWKPATTVVSGYFDVFDNTFLSDKEKLFFNPNFLAPSIALDGLGRPHIASILNYHWVNPESKSKVPWKEPDIVYSECNHNAKASVQSTGCLQSKEFKSAVAVKSAGEQFKDTPGSSIITAMDLAVDYKDTVYIAYTASGSDGYEYLFLTSCEQYPCASAAGWAKPQKLSLATVDKSEQLYPYTPDNYALSPLHTLTIKAFGDSLQIVYGSTTNNELHYWRCKSNCMQQEGWTDTLITYAAGRTSDLELTDKGRPRIVFKEASKSNAFSAPIVRFSWCDINCTDTGNWKLLTVQTLDKWPNHQNVSIDIDISGDVLLGFNSAYYKGKPKNVFFDATSYSRLKCMSISCTKYVIKGSVVLPIESGKYLIPGFTSFTDIASLGAGRVIVAVSQGELDVGDSAGQIILGPLNYYMQGGVYECTEGVSAETDMCFNGSDDYWDYLDGGIFKDQYGSKSLSHLIIGNNSVDVYPGKSLINGKTVEDNVTVFIAAVKKVDKYSEIVIYKKQFQAAKINYKTDAGDYLPLGSSSIESR